MPRAKTTAKASAKAKARSSASNRTSVVVNVAAPARRKSAPRKTLTRNSEKSVNAAPVAAAPRASFFFNHSTPQFAQAHAHELAQLAALQGIRQDLAAIKPAPAFAAAANPMYNAPTPTTSLTSAATPVEAAEEAFARGLPSPAEPAQRLPRRETMFDPAGGPLLASDTQTEPLHSVSEPRRTRPAAGSPGTVLNPLTGAYITVGGKRYKELVKQGKIFKD